ncbi:hypothetical protein EDD40_2378 [Saccharothrix texasensis]|uniref:Uncharacterized protein n=1 Tax=Saccharothrix texasensis TaxID=103734 RepID=A0A3N1H3L3_9PSEU|nr:hypothetical protein EDD40_2378 [Saccharothrix texasensis]
MNLSSGGRTRLRARIAAAVTGAVALAALVPGVAQASPPANDDFDQAGAITALPFAADVDFTEATRAEDDPVCTTGDVASVWFDYTAGSAGVLEVDVTGGGGSAGVAIHTGPRGAVQRVPDTGCWSSSVVVNSDETGCVYGVGCGCPTGWLIQAASGSRGGRGRCAKRCGYRVWARSRVACLWSRI